MMLVSAVARTEEMFKLDVLKMFDKQPILCYPSGGLEGATQVLESYLRTRMRSYRLLRRLIKETSNRGVSVEQSGKALDAKLYQLPV